MQISGLNLTPTPVSPAKEGNVDISPILQRLSALEAGLETKANKLEFEKKINLLNEHISSLQKQIDQVSGSFELFLSKDFA